MMNEYNIIIKTSEKSSLVCSNFSTNFAKISVFARYSKIRKKISYYSRNKRK